MNIIVCVKRVPETTEADIVIEKSGRDIDKSGFVLPWVQMMQSD
jgi:electron transfer flavoprotein alpha/beta subunit